MFGGSAPSGGFTFGQQNNNQQQQPGQQQGGGLFGGAAQQQPQQNAFGAGGGEYSRIVQKSGKGQGSVLTPDPVYT